MTVLALSLAEFIGHVGKAIKEHHHEKEALEKAMSLLNIVLIVVPLVALVFGTEMYGLTNDEVSRCQALAYIPANPDYGSLNLAAAVQVLAYELRMAAGLVGGYAALTYQPATQDEIAGLHLHAARTMRDLGFFNPERPRRLLPRLRRLFSRTRLEHEEVNILRGILASIDRALKKARSGKE